VVVDTLAAFCSPHSTWDHERELHRRRRVGRGALTYARRGYFTQGVARCSAGVRSACVVCRCFPTAMHHMYRYRAYQDDQACRNSMYYACLSIFVRIHWHGYDVYSRAMKRLVGTASSGDRQPQFICAIDKAIAILSLLITSSDRPPSNVGTTSPYAWSGRRSARTTPRRTHTRRLAGHHATSRDLRNGGRE
jgi:hypothetical protein